MIGRAFPRRFGIWLLAATLALQSLIGLVPMPMRAQAAMPAAAAGAQDATARLLADLAVICTPYGLRNLADHSKSGQPSGKIAHDLCTLCGLAANAALGVLHASGDCAAPAARAETVAMVERGARLALAFNLPPPGRGPPN